MTDYTYNTGNPIGSTDVRDGVDNLKSFDVLLNSTDDTYQDRLGNTVPTAAGAIKRLGPVVTAWTFTTGGTLNYPNEAALNPADGNYYGWTVEFPHVVTPGTDPTEWEIARCKAANYAFDQIRVWLVAVSEIPGDLSTIGALLVLIWTLAPAALLALIGVAVLELASVIFSWYALSEGIDEVAEYGVEWWDGHHEEIVCQFYEMSDNVVTRNAIVGSFLEDLAVWAAGRPWWVSSLLSMLQQVGGRLLPLQIFLAPWELVPPTGYVGSITCPCAPAEDSEWGEHDTYVWTPLTNAMLEAFTMTVDSPGQQNVKSHTLQDTGVITWSYSDAVSGDMLWQVLAASVVAAVEDGVRVTGIAWDFYESNPDTGSPYWYETMNGGAALDITVTPTFPKKWWVWTSNSGDTDINDVLIAIADYHGASTAMSTDILSNGEIQSGASHARNGRCRVRFLVKVES